MWFLNQRIYIVLVTSCILSLSLAVTPAVAGYNPTPQKSPVGKTGTSGSRGGCSGNSETSLTALAPQKHVGLTVSEHPTFAWFVPDSQPVAMEFSLSQYDPSSNSFKPIYKRSLQSSSQITKLSLPEDRPGLAVGQRYRWWVAILCDPNYPSNDIVVRGEIERVEMPPALNSALATNRKRSAAEYASAGLWYDALREATSVEDSMGAVATNLLEDLAQLEEPEQSQSLRQVADRWTSLELD